jgi:hypothetical protein
MYSHLHCFASIFVIDLLAHNLDVFSVFEFTVNIELIWLKCYFTVSTKITLMHFTLFCKFCDHTECFLPTLSGADVASVSEIHTTTMLELLVMVPL